MPVAVRRADGGEAQAVQVRVLDRWCDRSIRWALVDFQADAPAGSASYELVVDGPVPASHLDNIQVHVDGDGIAIDTGAARFRVAPPASFPFAAVEVYGHSALSAEHSGLTLVDEAGAAHRVRPERIWVEESGPVRTAVGLAASTRLSNGRIVHIAGRLEFFTGSASVRCDLTVHNPQRAIHEDGYWELGDPGSVFLRDCALTIALPESFDAAAVHCSAECGMPMTSVAGPVEIYQDSSGGENWRSLNHRDREGIVRRTIQGYRFRSATGEVEGRRSTPIVSLARGPRVVTVAMRQFWQNFPKALEATSDSIVVRLFPSNGGELHELQGGEQKTHRFVVAFAPDPVTDVPLDWCRSPLVAAADPSWYAATGALRHLVVDTESADPGQRELITAAVDGPDTFARQREVIDEYGWRNFGDLYADHESVGAASETPVISHYNNQYDAVAGFALQFMRTADRRWHELMADLAAHVVDIDIYHCDNDKAAYSGGLFWHTAHYVDAGLATHRTYPRAPGVPGGGPSNEHNYTAGLLLDYFMTGTPRSREAVIGLAQWVINMDDGARTPFRWVSRGHTGLASQSGSPFYHGPGRGAANSINALLDGYRLSGRADFLDKADEIIRRCIHPQDDIEARNLLDAERRWYYTVFLQALGRYLDDKAERAEFDDMYAYARASLLHYARWMAEHEHPYLEKPEVLEYPTETWAAQDIRKSDVFACAAVHTSEAERERFVGRASFFYRYSIDTLSRLPTRTFTRPVVLLLTNGWAYPHIRPQQRDPAPFRHPPTTFRRYQPFMPQKAKAVRLVRLAAGGAAVTAIVAALALLL